jgi:hypothetical protein
VNNTDALMAAMGRLCDKFIRYPGDQEGLELVEEMINLSFEKAGAAPPSRILLSFGEVGRIVMAFEGDL